LSVTDQIGGHVAALSLWEYPDRKMPLKRWRLPANLLQSTVQAPFYNSFSFTNLVIKYNHLYYFRRKGMANYCYTNKKNDETAKNVAGTVDLRFKKIKKI
jgi:hypothetical protein